MKLFGYEYGIHQQAQPMMLREVSILTTAAELRVIAKVLADLASEMEGAGFGHVHLADRVPDLGDDADLIVVKGE